MGEEVSQGGELVISMASALMVLNAVIFLLDGKQMGMLRMYLVYFLEKAC